MDDFNSLNPQKVKDIPNGKTGVLEDGRKINVRIEVLTDDQPWRYKTARINLSSVMMNKEGEYMQEKWFIWETHIDGFPDKIYLDSLTDNTEGLSLIFSNEDTDKIIRIIFEDSVMSYRNNDESYMLKTLNHVSEAYGNSFIKTNSIFIVENSLYIEWFNSQSYNIYKDFDLKHFVFMTPNDIVEVISIYPPKITLF